MCERCVRRESILDCQVLLDPGQAAFILLMRCHMEKMEQPERPSGHCKLIRLQLWIVQTAPNSERSLHGLPTDHITLRVHFSEGYLAWGRQLSPVSPSSCAICSPEKVNSEPVVLIGFLNAASDPVPHLVLSSTLRRWVEVKSTLVSSFWTSKSAVERSEMLLPSSTPSG